MSDAEPDPRRAGGCAACSPTPATTEPMPADVAARLDGALADLAPSADPSRPAVPAPRRRPRRAPAPASPRAVLVAAAAVVVVGVGDRPGRPAGGSDADGADGAADRRRAAADVGADAPSRPRAARRRGASRRRRPRRSLRAPATLRPAGATGSAPTPSSPPAATAPDDGYASAERRRRSPRGRALRRRRPGAAGARRRRCGTTGSPGVLVFRRARRATPQVVDLYLCGDADPVRADHAARALTRRRAGRGNSARLRSVVRSSSTCSTPIRQPARSRDSHVRHRRPQRHHHRLRPGRLHRRGLRRPRQPAARWSSRAR